MSKLFERLLEKRGVKADFLHPKYEELTRFSKEMPDIEKAAIRIVEAKRNGEKVLVYGDYDVDGVTATTILVKTLELLGITGVEMMLPDRFIDGYGMSKRLVTRAKEMEVSLVITVDCGSNNAEIIDELSSLGISVVVTDHHELSSEVPTGAVAVVNPKRPDFRKKALGIQAEIAEGKRPGADDILGLSDLSGAGVAFMLAKYLTVLGEIPDGQEKWLLDLATIGTLCDAMKMTKINRIICYYGMIVLAKTRRKGLSTLMQISGVKKLSTEAVGFQIGPRLNAAGRMETAELALKLLMTESKVEAAKLAEELNRLNAERRKQQQAAVTEVEAKGVTAEPVLVVSGKWHEGVLGIIAGRLTERYKKPCFVLTEVGDDLKGSGRSFGEYNLALALSECQDFLISGGGHAVAAGVRFPKRKLPEFCKKLNDYYKKLGLMDQERFLQKKPDLLVDDLTEFNLDFIDELRQLEPFGEGNDEPVFLLSGVLVLTTSKMGADGKHLRMLVRDRNGGTMKLVAFYAEEEWFGVKNGENIDVLVQLVENEWQGTRSVEGRLLGLERHAEY